MKQNVAILAALLISLYVTIKSSGNLIKLLLGYNNGQWSIGTAIGAWIAIGLIYTVIN